MSSLISDKKRMENFALAEENYAKARKKAGTTLLRWKPDWEQAARFYREAVKYYKLTGKGYERQTVAALKESAIAHKETGSWHTAAADIEAAAGIVREQGDAKAASELYAEAALLYRTHGSSHDKAASCLVKAAETIGEEDVQAGVEFMKQACSIFEEENRGVFHDATFKKAICFCVNKGKYGSARSLLHRQIVLAQAADLNTFEIDIYKNCLSIVVLRFHTEDYEKAKEELMKFESIARFARSEYCIAANEMIAAWEDGDAEKFEATMKGNTFKYLLNPIAQIARKMKMPEDQVQETKGSGSAAAASSSSAAPKKSRKKQIDLDEEEGSGEIDLR